ncbi:MAG: CynX/NimT family MFS transporter [Coriobacteriales bacterium]
MTTEVNSGASLQVPKMGKGAWAVMISVWIVGIVLAIAQYKAMATTTYIAEDMGLTASEAGWISGVFTFTGIILAFPAANVLKKLGPKMSLILSCAFAIVGGVIGFFAAGYVPMLISRVIEGIGLSFVGVVGPATIAMWFPIEKRGLPMGIWSNWQMVGISICFYSSAPMTMAWSWRSLWLLGVVCCIIGLVLAAIVVKAPPKEFNHADVQDEGTKLTKVFSMRDVWLVALAGLAFGLSNSVVIQWVAPYWINNTGMDPGMAGNLTGALFTTECVFTIIFGFIFNKMKSRKKAIVIDSALYSVTFLVIFSMTNVPAAIFSLFFYAIVEAFFCMAMWTLVGQTVTDPRVAAGAIALYTIMIDVGMWLGPIFSGMILDHAAVAAGVDPTGGAGAGVPGAFFGVMCFTIAAQVVATIAWGLLRLYNEQGERVKM